MILKPDYLEDCPEDQRYFPESWKLSVWRNFGDTHKGYQCPGCHQFFKGSDGYSKMEGHHILPWAKGGRTVWHNFQLICKACNLKKWKH
ncbi:MAG: HNH endonuclease [SAR324 cluster bacterium]|nr:HNH endonuclease [SAR324 cluster bacterium]